MSCGPTYYRPIGEWQHTGGGSAPPTAVIAGYDSGEPLYVGRAFHDGDVIPGKIQPSHGCLYIAFAGGEHRHQDYEVLCNPTGTQLEWVYTIGGNIPPGAIQGGHTASGEPMYIGRCDHEGTKTVGKVHPSHGVLYISYGGNEISKSEYEVLVCKSVCF